MAKKKKEDGKARWICSRCAGREQVEPETDPVILRACSWCSIENWVRPVGHGGADTDGGRLMEERVTAKGEKLPIYTKGQVAESIEVVAESVEAAEEAAPSEAPVEEEVNETMSPKEKEIADLKAQLAELEE